MYNSYQHLLCLVFMCVMSATPSRAQTPAARPRFEVASVKRNLSCGGRRGGGPPTPGRLTMECATPQTMIENAYAIFADGLTMSSRTIEISGGPSWMLSETYDIAAKAEDGAGYAQMAGPMMQALLEERFQLKTHRQSKEVPVYSLTVVKGGPKIEPAKAGRCVTIDINHPPALIPGQPRLPRCGSQSTSFKDGIVTLTASGIAMDLLANEPTLARLAGRPIIDKTGLTGQFDIRLEFAPESSMPAASGDATAAPAALPAGPSIFEAFELLGLRLEPGRGSVETLVIDHLERPSEN
jgi:uncharacterized protein (TIGR03435 family)